jgi:tRNA U34 5-methylaminomethyl-2-thiouridine-forming methyltransferase MnmC
MPEEPKVEVRRTRDGSATLYVPALDEQYHSRHGARLESQYVFIRHGLLPLLLAGVGREAPLRILEVGLGTGLNALLTLEASTAQGAAVEYDALETFPLPPAVVAQLQPEWVGRDELLASLFSKLHAARWGEAVALQPGFLLRKLHQPLQAATLEPRHYHLIYFDAFAPAKQPELWTEAIFRQLYAVGAPGAVLVSYCAKGEFRRNLRAAGWLTKKLLGTTGKREMTRATKRD